MAARGGFDDPAGIDFKRGRIELAQLGRDAINLAERAVKIFDVGDHHFVPQAAGFQIAHEVIIDHRKFAREIRFHKQILIGRLDTGRDSDDVRDGRGRRDGDAIGIAHAVLFDAGAQAVPVHAAGHIDFNIATALFAQQIE